MTQLFGGLLFAAPMLTLSGSASLYTAPEEPAQATSQPETDDQPGPPPEGGPAPVVTPQEAQSAPEPAAAAPAPAPEPEQPGGEASGGASAQVNAQRGLSADTRGTRNRSERRGRANRPQLDEGGYIYLAPAAAFMLEDEDFIDLQTSGQWSIGGGYHFRRDWFRASVGGTFEHTVLNFDEGDFPGDPPDGHYFRLMPEVRAGVGTDRVWGYGLFGVGVGIVHMASDTLFAGDDDETWVGPVVQVGTGIQGAVWRGLFLGAEVDFDLGFYDDDTFRVAPLNDDDFSIHVASLKFLVGYHFGRGSDRGRRR